MLSALSLPIQVTTSQNRNIIGNNSPKEEKESSRRGSLIPVFLSCYKNRKKSSVALRDRGNLSSTLQLTVINLSSTWKCFLTPLFWVKGVP